MPPRIILCPGQGAQFVGMGKAWYDRSPEARSFFDRADAILGNRLGASLTRLCFEGPVERINRTDVSQPAIYVTSLACWAGLMAQWGFPPDAPAPEAGVTAAAGLSLGEYTALALAGTFSFEAGLELVVLRGRAMQDAADAVRLPDGSPGSGMVALIGADAAQAEAVCAEARGSDVLVPANFNAPGQIVISGHIAACQRAVEVAGGMGLRATALPVAGAFHSPIMQPAADRLREALAATPMQPPRCPVMSNVTGLPHESPTGTAVSGSIEQSIRDRLVAQLTHPVLWEQGCRHLAGHFKGDYAELAPGKTLAGLMRRIEKSIKVETHDDPPAIPSPAPSPASAGQA